MDNSYQQQAIDLINERGALMIENEALKAQVNAMKGKLDWISGFMLENTEYKAFQKLFKWGKSTDDLLASTPEQCLNSVKKEAIEVFVRDCSESSLKLSMAAMEYCDNLNRANNAGAI